ncbi:MAG: protein translocase subunit SecF [Geminicoccaceae bacterium]
MRTFRLIPEKTHIPFMALRRIAFAVSGAAMVLSMLLIATLGLNFGIDFRGGILIEVRTPAPADLGRMRGALNDLGLGEVALQEFGQETDVLVRLERQQGDQAAQIEATETVKTAIAELVGEDVSFRRTEFVGPKVSQELLRAGVFAVTLALIAVMVYIWFRFEWQFGVGAITALVHDVLITLGVFALIRLEFNLSTVAALLTIVGYSLNDTVVVFDRVRENLRRYKRLSIIDLLDRSLNETLARTVVTSLTTLLALFALFFFGGEVIRGFTFGMILGVLVGTYSSIFVGTPLLVWLNLRREGEVQAAATTG